MAADAGGSPASGRSRSPARRTPRRKGSEEEASALVRQLKALLLGLERRPDRRARCEAMLQAEVPWLDVEFFPATDGKDESQPISDDVVARSWNTKRNAMYGDYEDIFEKDGKTLIHSKADFEDPGVEYLFSPGERGCAHSHFGMWQRAACSEHPTLILEDDVDLRFQRGDGRGRSNGKLFTARLELAMQEATNRGADVLYLGWAGFRDGNYKFHKTGRGRRNPILRKAEYVWTTVAYVIWPQGAKKLLNAASPIDQPVDNFMAWECREGRLQSFVVLDEGDAGAWDGGIVRQVDFVGDSDIKKSDGGVQDDDPAFYLAARKQN
mmetsp:Transcript_15335/g.27340  ORF Transcript_15335/g.27340 Transcript_15335/m.27340 type:complete len:324 (-) Transcript_15335:77-1048(-)